MNPPKMPIHIGDYKRDTGHLRAAQHGAYLLLLFHHWSTGSLPDDDGQLAAIACMTRAEWKRAKPVIAKFFKPGWKHGRVIDDLAKAEESYQKRAKAGAEGGKAKANGKQNSSNATAELSNATAMPQQPLTTYQGTKEKKEDTADAVTTSGKYAFESGIIRLNQRDLDLWKTSFSHLDVPAELLGLTKWADEQGSNWFHAVKGALNKRNRTVKATAQQAAKPEPEFKWQSGIEGVY